MATPPNHSKAASSSGTCPVVDAGVAKQLKISENWRKEEVSSAFWGAPTQPFRILSRGKISKGGKDTIKKNLLAEGRGAQISIGKY